MSNVAEQKALEAYPPKYDDLLESNVHRRIGYKQGYDIAMQDFFEKANSYFIEIANKAQIVLPKLFFDDFKNYIQNES